MLHAKKTLISLSKRRSLSLHELVHSIFFSLKYIRKFAKRVSNAKLLKRFHYCWLWAGICPVRLSDGRRVKLNFERICSPVMKWIYFWSNWGLHFWHTISKQYNAFLVKAFLPNVPEIESNGIQFYRKLILWESFYTIEVKQKCALYR